MPLDTTAGQAVYTPLSLRLYDLVVVRLSCDHVWRCPARHLLAQYDRLVGRRHLDVGVGSGFYLDRCRFPARPELTLLDLNPVSLAHAARRVARYAPRTVQHDVFAPLPFAERFDSVALSFLLHCLPGAMADKAAAIAHLSRAVAPEGVLFGSTILGDGAAHNALGRRLMRVYNRKGFFGNARDDADGLAAALGASFAEVKLSQVGTVALFEARAPRSG